MRSDATRFGPTVDALVGRAFAASLHPNALNLAFDPKNHHHEYIWIDPPWVLFHEEELAMSSSDYSYRNFNKWGKQLAPVQSARLLGWSVAPDLTTVFDLDRGYRIALSIEATRPGDNVLYVQWFAVGPAV